MNPSRTGMKLLAPSYREHVMLMCKGRDEQDSAAIDMLNEALTAGQLCIYASVLNGNREHLDKIASSIPDYQLRVQAGDLVIIDFKPFSESAGRSDFSLFAGLKARVEEMIRERIAKGKSDKVLVFAEAAGELCEQGHFDKSADLEGWWNDVHAEWVKNLNITIVCPHPAPMLGSVMVAKNNIAHAHTLTLELTKFAERKGPLSGKNMRILIIEPEADLRSVYHRYLERLGGLQAVVAGTGKEALDHALSTDGQGFDVVMIDAHLKDAPAIEVARRLIAAIPDQRIVFTTTSSIAEMKAQIRTIRLNSEEVLAKPFPMATLLGMLAPVEKQGKPAEELQ